MKDRRGCPAILGANIKLNSLNVMVATVFKVYDFPWQYSAASEWAERMHTWNFPRLEFCQMS